MVAFILEKLGGSNAFLITLDTQPLDNLSNVRQAVEKT